MRRRARPHRAGAGALPGPGLRLRRVRAAGDPAHRGLLLGEAGQPRPPSGDLPPHPWRHLLPRLLLRGRRPSVGRQPARQGHCQQPGRAEADPRRPARWRPDPPRPGQLLRSYRRGNPPLGEEEQGRAVLPPDLHLLGQPGRGALRSAAAVHPGQLASPQPSRTGPCPAPLPALAQRRRQRPPSRQSWPLAVENGPASAARRAFAGEDACSLARSDSTLCPSPPPHRRIQRSHS